MLLAKITSLPSRQTVTRVVVPSALVSSSTHSGVCPASTGCAGCVRTRSADSSSMVLRSEMCSVVLSALLVRTHPAQPVDAAQTPLCVLEESNADGTTTRVTVWRDGKDVIFASSADAQSYRVPGAAAEFCRLTGLPEN